MVDDLEEENSTGEISDSESTSSAASCIVVTRSVEIIHD